MSDLPEYEKRVIVEKQELDEKIRKLTEFRSTETHKQLTFMERGLLGSQLRAMTNYSDALGKRLAYMGAARKLNEINDKSAAQ